jgi:hypothetical protein
VLDVAGTGFSSGATVAFGGQGSPSITVLSPTEIEAVAPGGSGTVDVRVTTANGTSPAVSADRYTYVAATVTGPTPVPYRVYLPAVMNAAGGW